MNKFQAKFQAKVEAAKTIMQKDLDGRVPDAKTFTLIRKYFRDIHGFKTTEIRRALNEYLRELSVSAINSAAA